jgi:hypothetical protein
MVRGVIHRIVVAAGALTATAALMLAVTPMAASAAQAGPAVARQEQAPAAAPKKAPPKPDTVKIVGRGIPEPGLTVRAADDAEVFNALVTQVSWLKNEPAQLRAPAKDKLGTKFTLTVLVRDAAQETYDLYPLAKGGPKAYRPAKQPRGKSTAAWFYGRLSMPETLRLGGVPLPVQTELLTGGIGGGERGAVPETIDGNEDLTAFVGELRQLVLLNGAVVLTIAIGLAGMSYLIRRKV